MFSEDYALYTLFAFLAYFKQSISNLALIADYS